ncbi:hypothetical protein Desor_2764 [Desulfosporosinus orientis DSM 765]|uniref:GrdX protein n=1 Tax=Desulfosporosinus orientis (strain ATCC 19365 / DSM 765 / NCIMB 8382 / VKM B-1628 / Singapore I) TaxID=768706 RepID=G7WBH5_DESOD|nr:GrdX family protein [Desulfosporosinus orientis]AET68304.1 hypothetical protein Desor_2764 [Desulfosporosinus orientis DSM 765]
MKNLIVTNNPAVAEQRNNVLFVDGSVEEVLIKVRDLVHQGYELISHPLGASIRIIFSPFRSIVLGKKSARADQLSVEIIEDSILKYTRHMAFRNKETVAGDDYQMIDLILIESALLEQPVLL